MHENWNELADRAAKSLRLNLVETNFGQMIAAGSHQFKTIWIRDFCFAVPGLLKLGYANLVRRQLELILNLQRIDGLFPRGIDVINPKLRVLWGLYGLKLGLRNLPQFSYNKKTMRPEYHGEHATIAFDSNILVLTAVLQYAGHTKEHTFLSQNVLRLQKALEFYLPFYSEETGFSQPAYSDWQDSLKRDGPQAYFHFLIWRFLSSAESYVELNEITNTFIVNSSQLEHRIYEQFLNKSKWRSLSFESLLWAVQDAPMNFKISPDEFLSVYDKAKWGNASLENRGSRSSWTTRIVGLRGYHTTMRWSWLMAEAAIVFRKFQPDWRNEILLEINRISEKLELIGEIYVENQIFEGLLYKSEIPFTWGAAKLAEACIVTD